MVVAGPHLFDGSGEGTLSIGPPVRGVGEEGKGEGHETPADALGAVAFEEVARQFGECGEHDDAEDECNISLAGNEEKHKDEAVQGGSRAETLDDACRPQVHEC